MKKAALLQPGRYTAALLDVLRRTDLTPADKCLHFALVDCLHNGHEWFVAPVPALAGATALDARSILRGLARLCAVRLLARRPEPGRPTRYRLLRVTASSSRLPSADLCPQVPGAKQSPVPKSHRCQKVTGAKLTPVPKRHRCQIDTGAKLTPATIVNGAFSVLTLKEQIQRTPPTPPRRGGERAPLSPAENRETKDANTHRETESDRLADLTGRIDAAHRQVYGVGLTASAKRKIRNEYTHGDPALLEALDADTLRAGDRLADSQKRTHGFGWALKAALAQAASNLEKNRRDAKSKIENRKSEMGDYARASGERLAHFRALPETKRQEYIQCASPKWKIQPAALEALAAGLAWEERSRT